MVTGLGLSKFLTIRFDSKETSETAVKFFTDGMLLRDLIANPMLPGVGCVIVDEAFVIFSNS